MKKKLYYYFLNNSLVCLFILFIGLLTLSGIFKYGICCDDILAAFDGKAYGRPSIFTPYGGQFVSMAIMYKIFALHSEYYFYSIFILRYIAAISIYFLSLTILKNKLASLFTAILFMIGYAGISTVEYAILINIPISLILLNLGLILLNYYYKIFSNNIGLKSLSIFIIISLLFTSSITIATVRVSPLIFYYLFIELGLLISKYTKLKSAIIRIILFYTFILILQHLGSFGGSSHYHLTMIKEGIMSTFGTFILAVKTIYYNTAIYYDIISPPYLDKFTLTILDKINLTALINNNSIFLFLSVIMFCVDISIYKKLRKNRIFIIHFIFWLIYLFGFKWAFNDLFPSYKYIPITTTSYVFDAMNALLGGLFIFLVVNILFILLIKKEKLVAFKTFLFLVWPISFMIVTYFFSPRTFVFGTWAYPVEYQESYVHYYFVPAIGIYLLLTYLGFCVFPLLFKKIRFHLIPQYLSYNLFIILVFAILVILNILSVQQWIWGREYRFAAVLDSISQTINNEIKANYLIQKKPVIYLTSLDDNAVFFPYAVTEWGFAEFRYALMNRNYSITPYFVTGSIDSLKTDIIGNKKFADDHGIKSVINIDDIYAYKIEKHKIYSQTNELRKYLRNNLY